MSRHQEFCPSIPFFNLNLEGLQPQLGERRQIHLHDHQLPAELKELVKTDNVEEIHLVQATIRVAVHIVVKFKITVTMTNSQNMTFSSLNEELICLLNQNEESHIYMPSFVNHNKYIH